MTHCLFDPAAPFQEIRAQPPQIACFNRGMSKAFYGSFTSNCQSRAALKSHSLVVVRPDRPWLAQRVGPNPLCRATPGSAAGVVSRTELQFTGGLSPECVTASWRGWLGNENGVERRSSDADVSDVSFAASSITQGGRPAKECRLRGPDAGAASVRLGAVQRRLRYRRRLASGNTGVLPVASARRLWLCPPWHLRSGESARYAHRALVLSHRAFASIGTRPNVS